MTELPDRLLREALRGPASLAPSGACLDADALAAWADDTMSGAARAATETHAAGCARCQALMAAMLRTEPPPAPSAGLRRWLVAWLVPLTVATASLVVVVTLARIERRAPPAQPMARVE